MSGWTKLFSSLPTSSIWSEAYATRIVWTTMLAVADAEGLVEGSVPGFARLANVTIEEMQTAIDRLSSPDPYSRTPDHDGCRIERVQGGWRILNYRLYRERVGQSAERMRRWRDRHGVTPRHCDATSRDVTAEAEAEAEEEEEREAPEAPSPRAEDLTQRRDEAPRPPHRPIRRHGPSVGLLKPNGNVAYENPRVYVPWKLHYKLVGLRNHPGASDELMAWYPKVGDEWAAGARKDDDPDPDMFRFWTARYKERWPPKSTRSTDDQGPAIPGHAETMADLDRQLGDANG